MNNFVLKLTVFVLSGFVYFAKAKPKDNHAHKNEHQEVLSQHNKHEEDTHNHNHGNDHKHDEHEQEINNSKAKHIHDENTFGEGKAITEVINNGQRFKLTKDSMILLGIKITVLESISKSLFKVPVKALVQYQNHLGVFVTENGWFELIDLEKVTQAPNYILIHSPKLHQGMHVVISGVSLLRIAHLQASGHGGTGHAH